MPWRRKLRQPMGARPAPPEGPLQSGALPPEMPPSRPEVGAIRRSRRSAPRRGPFSPPPEVTHKPRRLSPGPDAFLGAPFLRPRSGRPFSGRALLMRYLRTVPRPGERSAARRCPEPSHPPHPTHVISLPFDPPPPKLRTRPEASAFPSGAARAAAPPRREHSATRGRGCVGRTAEHRSAISGYFRQRSATGTGRSSAKKATPPS